MRGLRENPPMPTIEDLRQAHGWFEGIEPRALIYRAATALVRLALGDKDRVPLKLEDAVALLLRTWNEAFYRFKKKIFNEAHIAAIGRLLADNEARLRDLRQRAIVTLRDDDRSAVESMFGDFEAEVGTVGASKCLHLLAPDFFPLWDRSIALKGYGLALTKRNAEQYWRFMKTTKTQCERLREPYQRFRNYLAPNLLKALDEYNYRMTRDPELVAAAGQARVSGNR
jgi:hypothetical protein